MKYLISFLLALSLLSARTTVSQDQPRSASLIELIASPKEFDRKPVLVIAFLVMGERSMLFLHQEDADHALANSIDLSPSDEMQRHKEDLNGKYVYVIGVFRAVPTPNGGTAKFITDIKKCTVWSDSEHPRGSGGYGKRHSK